MDSTPSLRPRIYEMLMESQYWPQEMMLEFQRDQLTHLLRHAKATVPFYKTRLDPVFKKNGDIDWDRWHEIPVVTRADLRERRTELLARDLPPGHGPTREFSTSGSSGVPVTVTTTAISSAARLAATQRMRTLHKLDASKNFATFVFPNELKGTIFNDGNTPAWSFELQDGCTKNIKINLFLPDARKLDILVREKVGSLSHLPNTAEILAYENNKLGKPLQLESFLFYGQHISDEQRRKVADSFGARCVSIYSSKEAGLMACQCPAHNHFHINGELVFLEVLNERHLPCVTGETGRVVVTPFHSTAQPLIRYEQGDLATLGQACDCGSELPVLLRIDGRQDPIFRFPDRLGSEVLIDKAMLQKALRAAAIQMAQTNELKFEIRYVADADATPRAKTKINKHLRQVLHPLLNFEYKRLAEIPRNAGGKQQRFVREFA
jgi:phenylacetate-coenzyme A ligase PaaK-like adenylate-forming protein